jgi:Spy/CpxP family protein refolding chaperone
VFTLPAEAPAAAFPADVVMMAGTPGAPAPPVFAWQGEAGERIFLRHAHGGPELGKWWKDSKIVTELKLTPAQITQIEQSFYDHRLKLIDLRADLEREETKLQPLVEADQPDEGKVSAQVDLVLAARGRLEKAHIMMMLAMRRSLSVEQWKKLESIKHERQGGWAGSMIAPRARGFHLAHPPQPAQPAQPAPAATPKPGDRM